MGQNPNRWRTFLGNLEISTFSRAPHGDKFIGFLGKILRAAGENFGDFKRERTGFHTILSQFVLKAIKASLYVARDAM